MPSDDRSRAALKALVRRRRAFEEALAATADDIRHHLAEGQTSVHDRLNRLTAELGEFGATYLDPARFTALFDHEPSVAAAALETVETALATINELRGREAHLFLTSVDGQSLYDATDHALARIGRAFGAARVVNAIRAGRYRLSEHARSLGSFPFARWNRAERHLAPPLVVEVDGRDLRAGALVEFLDGSVTLVLVVRGACSPAPLARLISPAVYVAQHCDAAALERLADFAGPAIVGLVPEGCAVFVHDPRVGAAGPTLTADFVPPEERRAAVGGLSPAQQLDEIRLLKRLAQASVAEASTSVDVAQDRPADPADKLAAWLLNQADLEGLG